MRAAVVFPIDVDFAGNKGILRKLDAQAKAFGTLVGESVAVAASREGVLVDGVLRSRYLLSGERRPMRIINHYAGFWWEIWRVLNPRDIEILYVRYPGSSPQLLASLLYARRENSNICVIIEIPTYPFRQEFETARQRVILAFDDTFSPLLRLVADFVVTFYGQTSIYGLPTVATENGVDVNAFRVSRTPVFSNELHLLAVAGIARMHGLDRLLRGLAAYDGAVRCSLEVVGEGPERKSLQGLVAELRLGDRVRFLGVRTGTELDAAFDRAHVAIGSFGMHRLSLETASSLKTREYCARGRPFVLAGPDVDFPPGLPFVLHMPADEQPIDIKAIVEWYARVRADRDPAPIARAYAEAHLTWVKKLEAVARRAESIVHARTDRRRL